MEVKMEVNSLRSWKLKWTLPLLSAVVLSCTHNWLRRYSQVFPITTKSPRWGNFDLSQFGRFACILNSKFFDRGSENEVYLSRCGTEIVKLNDFRYSWLWQRFWWARTTKNASILSNIPKTGHTASRIDVVTLSSAD